MTRSQLAKGGIKCNNWIVQVNDTHRSGEEITSSQTQEQCAERNMIGRRVRDLSFIISFLLKKQPKAIFDSLIFLLEMKAKVKELVTKDKSFILLSRQKGKKYLGLITMTLTLFNIILYDGKSENRSRKRENSFCTQLLIVFVSFSVPMGKRAGIQRQYIADNTGRGEAKGSDKGR